MSQQKIGGIATILGKRFVFPTDGGFGLVELDGDMALVEFSCPLESLPPQGAGHVLGSSGLVLKLEHGQLQYDGKPVVLGHLVGS